MEYLLLICGRLEKRVADKVRNNRISCKVEDAICKNLSKFKYPDQDLINTIYQNNIGCLKLENNVLSQMYAFSYEDYIHYRNCQDYYSKDEFISSIASPSILHFSGGFAYARPWFRNSLHPMREVFLRYYELANNSIEYWGNDNRSRKQKTFAQIIHRTPRLLKRSMLRVARALNNR